MQFIDLKVQQNVIKDNIDTNIRQVLDHGQYIMGPEVGELEHRLAQYVGTGHSVACSSGTDALLLALMAYGVGPGDAIFTTPFTFIATAEVISVLGATPVFVDIEPGTFNINPGHLSRAIAAVNNNDPWIYPLPDLHPPPSNRTPRGIIAVDLFGLPADYDRINALAQDHGLFVIEDAAQSFGAVYKGNPAGSLSHIACTSFFPAKPLGCYGDGGMCFTDDDDLAEAVRSIRVHGKGAYKYDNAVWASTAGWIPCRRPSSLPNSIFFPRKSYAAKRLRNGMLKNSVLCRLWSVLWFLRVIKASGPSTRSWPGTRNTAPICRKR
ncbi:MAG: UDP-2-acetamido-2-deoxy-ribo-hexuluronate aminotransferase [Desulfobacteraceae bacterium Eth-SRB2]|nr:MAG: UDP-2-acetamido-2-deoxy-ribo-hexuluronate aminotransferase [Desulfobacteraceae bacterium Eth-SRB2]